MALHRPQDQAEILSSEMERMSRRKALLLGGSKSPLAFGPQQAVQRGAPRVSVKSFGNLRMPLKNLDFTVGASGPRVAVKVKTKADLKRRGKKVRFTVRF